ncbi:hypothetical protein MAHJHV63_53540 [Mycobacterium avium subsp. hominissuis]
MFVDWSAPHADVSLSLIVALGLDRGRIHASVCRKPGLSWQVSSLVLHSVQSRSVILALPIVAVVSATLWCGQRGRWVASL